MPAFCLPLPRFLRGHCSQRFHSTQPSPGRDEASYPVHFGHSAGLSSSPSTAQEDTGQAVRAATGPARSRTSNNVTHLQSSTVRLDVEMALGDCSDQQSRVSQTIALLNGIDSHSTPKPHDLVSLPSAHLSHLHNSMDPTLSPPLRLPQPSTTSQQYAVSQRQSTPSGKDMPSPHYLNKEAFKDAHDFTMMGPNFIDNNKGNIQLTNINTSHFSISKNFMEVLLNVTIPGAASDSSARYPPPRCHPGTRLAVLERCLHFVAHCKGQKKLRWVVGAAGVGKSAIMQSVADSPQLPVTYNASVFFSIIGRNDGTKAMVTLSYQLAVKSDLYRQVIEDAITKDPRLLQSSMPVQFEKLIVQPFIHNPDLNSAGRVLIIIDGLDECKETDVQVDILRSISNFCISHPSSPIVWLIASRPEPHITSFFSRAEVLPAYEKEEIAVDTHQARADVERFLRDKLTEIREASDSLDPHWPDERHLWKLSQAAGGLFAYAHTVIRYIGDSNVGDPVSQLSDVLNVIDEHPMPNVAGEAHPMAQLDALYARILSNVPRKVMISTRKLLLALASNWDLALEHNETSKNFLVLCNWLGMTADEAYAAVNRLRSVLSFPRRREAYKEPLKPFHKSFIDYLSRSGFSVDIKLEAQHMRTKRALKEAFNGNDFAYADGGFYYGWLSRQTGAGRKISITWPTDEKIVWNDNRTRLAMYKLAIGEVVAGVERGESAFQNELFIKLLATRFESYFPQFPCYALLKLVLDRSRRHEFVLQGILKQIKAADVSGLTDVHRIVIHFHRPVTIATQPDPWRPSCKHKREGVKGQDWTSTFDPQKCTFCFQRYERQVESWIKRFPDGAVTIMFTSAGECCVELRIVDPDGSASEWTYWAWIGLDTDKRKKLGSTI